MKKIAILLAFALLLIVSVSAVAESFSIAVIYSDTVDDKGWCQTMDTNIKGVIAAGYDIEYTPVESVDPTAAMNVIEQLVDEYDVIIVHGAQFMSATAEAAAEYPEQIFALGTTDQILGDNVFTYMPMSEEPGYLNGIVAALTTKANKVGIVGASEGGDAIRYVKGFVMGLKDANPDCEYMLSYTGSFSDTIGAGDIGKTYIEAGCDVLVGPAQQAVGALRNVDAAEGVTWVAQTLNQMVDFPNVTRAAADYNYGAIIVELIERVGAGETGGVNIPLNYANGGYTYTFSENAELMPEDVRAAVEAAHDTLCAEAGTLDIASVQP